jgi:hypothetical protein
VKTVVPVLVAHIDRLMRAYSITDDRLRREATVELPDGRVADPERS